MQKLGSEKDVEKGFHNDHRLHGPGWLPAE